MRICSLNERMLIVRRLACVYRDLAFKGSWVVWLVGEDRYWSLIYSFGNSIHKGVILLMHLCWLIVLND